MTRRVRSAALLALLAVAAVAVGGCGGAATGSGGGVNVNVNGAVVHPHPQAVDPVAGDAAQLGAASASGGVSASAGSAGVSVGAAAGGPLQQPLSNAAVRRQLSQSGISANVDQASLTPSGLAIPPSNAPPAVVEMIDAANTIARLPYVWGGGHMTYEDTGYDCSGSLSFILASAGLLNGTMTSGEFMHYGDAGLGRWVTIFAMNGHTFAYIAGLRFDTVALAETGSRWSNKPADEPNLSSFVARHPPGL